MRRSLRIYVTSQSLVTSKIDRLDVLVCDCSQLPSLCDCCTAFGNDNFILAWFLFVIADNWLASVIANNHNFILAITATVDSRREAIFQIGG